MYKTGLLASFFWSLRLSKDKDNDKYVSGVASQTPDTNNAKVRTKSNHDSLSDEP
jgi:hypothetical protein